ncbi:MAG: TlpA family protein disulfide reductase, partial [Gemmatimonadaceae bacterium]|nr:TlpA family protein disulfide reductase [Gemmatimonadaceae bacterium]
GTPTTVLIDARGRLRRQLFGVHDDLLLGAEIGTLLVEA